MSGVEETIQNGVKHLRHRKGADDSRAENIIQNGVKEAKPMEEWVNSKKIVDKTIQNGVKETRSGCDLLIDDSIEDAIQNGVKHTRRNGDSMNTEAEDAIQNGVKETELHKGVRPASVEDTIKHGVKSTKNLRVQEITMVEPTIQKIRDIEDTIQNGVKHTEYGDWLDGDERFDDIIQNGVKETKTPGEDGDIMGALDFMSDNNTNNLSHLINDVIEKGIKQTEAAALFDETKVDRIISEGVKETKGGGYLGSIEMKGKMVHQLESPKQNNEVEEVIEHGVKLTNSSLQIDGSCVVEDVIQNGIKETHDDVYHHKGRVDDVIKNGIKE
jgi:predicted peroxiredoxin